MKYNLEESFTYVTHDKEWLKKFLIAGGYAIAAVLLFVVSLIIPFATKTFNATAFIGVGISWFIGFIFLLAINGFCLKIGHDRIYDRTVPLPDWSGFWSFVFIGIKSSIGSFIFFLPVIALSFVSASYEIAARVHGVSSTTASAFSENIANIVYFVFLFFYFIFHANFIKDFNAFSYLNVAAAYRILKVKENFINYLILAALILALGSIFNFAAVLLCLTIAGILVVPFAGVFVQFVSMDFMAQFLRITENKQETNNI